MPQRGWGKSWSHKSWDESGGGNGYWQWRPSNWQGEDDWDGGEDEWEASGDWDDWQEKQRPQGRWKRDGQRHRGSGGGSKHHRPQNKRWVKKGGEDYQLCINGKTGANTIEVAWSPPVKEVAPEPVRELSPVRGPVGRGRQNTMPAWMTQQNPEIPALCDKGPDEAKEAAAPAASEKSPSPVRGPAGRGRGQTMPAWMTQGVGNTATAEIDQNPKIPEEDKEHEGRLAAMDEFFEESKSSKAPPTTVFSTRGEKRPNGGKETPPWREEAWEEKWGQPWEQEEDWDQWKPWQQKWQQKDWHEWSDSSWNKASWSKRKWQEGDEWSPSPRKQREVWEEPSTTREDWDEEPWEEAEPDQKRQRREGLPSAYQVPPPCRAPVTAGAALLATTPKAPPKVTIVATAKSLPRGGALPGPPKLPPGRPQTLEGHWPLQAQRPKQPSAAASSGLTALDRMVEEEARGGADAAQARQKRGLPQPRALVLSYPKAPWAVDGEARRLEMMEKQREEEDQQRNHSAWEEERQAYEQQKEEQRRQQQEQQRQQEIMEQQHQQQQQRQMEQQRRQELAEQQRRLWEQQQVHEQQRHIAQQQIQLAQQQRLYQPQAQLLAKQEQERQNHTNEEEVTKDIMQLLQKNLRAQGSENSPTSHQQTPDPPMLKDQGLEDYEQRALLGHAQEKKRAILEQTKAKAEEKMEAERQESKMMRRFQVEVSNEERRAADRRAQEEAKRQLALLEAQEAERRQAQERRKEERAEEARRQAQLQAQANNVATKSLEDQVPASALPASSQASMRPAQAVQTPTQLLAQQAQQQYQQEQQLKLQSFQPLMTQDQQFQQYQRSFQQLQMQQQMQPQQMQQQQQQQMQPQYTQFTQPQYQLLQQQMYLQRQQMMAMQGQF